MSQRSAQVAEELRKIISMILIDDIDDSRMGFITITRIELTDDLRYAKVFYSVLGSEEQIASTEEALAENLGYIKKLAVQRINMKYAMTLKFELDKSIAHSFKIDSILNKIKKTEPGPEPKGE
jgi:ribosome-binding factor A